VGGDCASLLAASAGMDFEEMPDEHEIIASAADCFASARSRRVGNYRIQRDQNPGEFVCSGIFDTAEPKPSATVDAAIHTEGAKPQAAARKKENALRDDSKPSHSPSKLSSKDDHANAPSVANRPSHKATASQEATPGGPVSFWKNIRREKGDNPVTIAKN